MILQSSKQCQKNIMMYIILLKIWISLGIQMTNSKHLTQSVRPKIEKQVFFNFVWKLFRKVKKNQENVFYWRNTSDCFWTFNPCYDFCSSPFRSSDIYRFLLKSKLSFIADICHNMLSFDKFFLKNVKL